MRVMVMVRATPSSEAGTMPGEKLLTDMGNFNEQLVQAGLLVSGEGLKPSSAGARVHFSGTNRTVTDGPFTETKELIAGFWIWNVKSMQEAIDWVKRCPNPMLEDSDIEIRPVFEADDFGDEFTPELREQEATLRAQGMGLNAPQYVESPARLIAGLSESYTPERRMYIPAHWQRFAPSIGHVPGQLGGMTAYGVCWNTTPDCGFDYLTGVEVTNDDDLPSEFTTVELPAGRYAVFAHTEHVASISKTIDTIWTKWALECGLKLADTPCFERYTEDYNPATGTGGMEIWIPLQG